MAPGLLPPTPTPRSAPYLATDFSVTAPNYLPWGGTHVGSAFFENVLHHLPELQS
jgi:hypothetical protein